jgi:hypothetical protein
LDKTTGTGVPEKIVWTGWSDRLAWPGQLGQNRPERDRKDRAAHNDLRTYFAKKLRKLTFSSTVLRKYLENYHLRRFQILKSFLKNENVVKPRLAHLCEIWLFVSITALSIHIASSRFQSRETVL